MKTIFNPAYKKLVTRLREERIRQGLRQEDAAKKMGVSRHWIQKVETCQTRLDVVQFVRLCRIYELTPSQLIRRLEEELSDEDASFYLLPRMTACCTCSGRQYPHADPQGRISSIQNCEFHNSMSFFTYESSSARQTAVV